MTNINQKERLLESNLRMSTGLFIAMQDVLNEDHPISRRKEDMLHWNHALNNVKEALSDINNSDFEIEWEELN